MLAAQPAFNTGGSPAIRSIRVTSEVIGKTPVSVASGLEDVNHEIYGGIYSQMIYGEAFAEPERSPGISGMWRATGTSQGTRFSLVSAAPFKGKQSQRIERQVSGAWSGVENRGLNRQGLSIIAGKPYMGTIVLRSSDKVPVRVSLQSADGATVYASQTMTPTARDWANYPFTLAPSQSDEHARLAVEIASAGAVDIGYVFAEPGPWGLYKGLPVRADVGRAMEGQGLQAIRFGGCANSGCGDVSDYKWKTMIGPAAERPVTKGFWYPYESNGFGIFEFLQLGEALGIEAVPSLNIDESPDDIRDLMEYLYGSAHTKWGARRAADGHPAPYKVSRFELGNEDTIDDAYYAKFKALADIIWSYDHGIRLVVGDFTYEDVIGNPLSFAGGGKVHSLAAHQKILELAAKWNAEVDFDVHLWTRKIDDGGWHRKDGSVRTQIDALDSYAAALQALAPEKTRFKIIVFELNANSHDLTRALANAYAITALQKRPYLALVSSANALQVDGQNDNGWNQGLIFMNQGRTWTQPPFAVHQMIAGSFRTNVLKTDVDGIDDRFEATAFGDSSGRSLDVVNASDEARTYVVDLGRNAGNADLSVTMLGDDRGTAVNTADNPDNIAPETFRLQLDAAGRATYRFPPRSFTTLRTSPR
jgi:hypothetical protein